MAVNKRKILEAAQKFLQKGALDKALREYRTLLDLDPRDSGARLKLGDIHLRLGEKDDAVASYLKVAHQFMKDGFDAKAVALFKQIAKLAPDQIEVHVPLAELYQRLGLTPEAMSALQTAVEAYQKAGRKREALELLRKAAALDPTNTTSRLKIADLLRAQGMNDEALNEYEEVAAELERHGETEGLTGVYERMLEVDPDRLSALLALARLSLRESAPERALELSARAATLRPDLMDAVQLHAETMQAVGRPMEEQEPVWRRLAELHRARGDEAGGRAILQRFCSSYDLTQNGVDLGNAQGEGVALIAEEGVSEPGELTRAGSELGPSLPPADDLLFAAPGREEAPTPTAGPPGDADVEQLLAEAGVYLRFGKRERAIASLEAVLAREPDHPTALEKLAGAVAHAGDLPRATALLARGVASLEARGDTNGAAQLRARIAELDPAAPGDDGGLADAALPDFERDGRHGLGPEAPAAPTEAPDLAEAPPAEGGIASEESPFELEVELDFSDADHPLPELELERPVSEAAEPAASRVLETEEAEALPEPEPEAEPEEISAEGIEVELRDVAPTPATAAERDLATVDDEVGLARVDDEVGIPMVGAEPAFAPMEPLDLEDATPLGGSVPVEVAAGPAPLPAAEEIGSVAQGDPEPPAEDDGQMAAGPEVALPEETEVALPEEPALIALEAPSVSSLQVSPKQILEDLEEGDFYFQQQLLDEAEAVYRRVLEAAPTNPQALLRLGEIAAARGHDPAGARSGPLQTADRYETTQPSVALAAPLEPSFGDDLAEWSDETVAVGSAPSEATLVTGLGAEPPVAESLADDPGEALDEGPGEAPWTDETEGEGVPLDEAAATREVSHFDLAAELSDALAEEPTPADSSPSLTPETEPSLEAIFSEFKRGVQKTLTAADHETHYDLGIAYREMGLYEDAMGEFRIALESPQRRLDCLHLLGLCARDLKRPQDAVAFLRQALSDGELDAERRVATLFDLALALEEAGQTPESLATLERVAEEAPDHPGLAERLEALRALQTLSPAELSVEAEPENGEVFESFDDLIADAEAAFAAGGPAAPDRTPERARPEPPPDRPTPEPPRGTPPRRRKISFG